MAYASVASAQGLLSLYQHQLDGLQYIAASEDDRCVAAADRHVQSCLRKWPRSIQGFRLSPSYLKVAANLSDRPPQTSMQTDRANGALLLTCPASQRLRLAIEVIRPRRS